ncbi:LysR family transcriptional regulator [Pseudoduganella sp. LjRoot289]|uniref:LysR family transcriptional regulator n=1 Tax=Pseudoduganella sp. LjRoot289 TaxID=3342314 RepID=UPI003ECC6E8E
MANDFDWNDIPLILSLARTGSMSASGRTLGVDASTISRRIGAAEKSLQLRLFIRDNTRYQLTEAGRVFVEHGEAVYGNVQSMLLASSSEAEAISGQVRIAAIDFLFNYWLLPHLPALNAQYPQLELHLMAGNDNLSFTRREADFALRLAQPGEDAALVMRKLGDIGWAVYGSAASEPVPREQWGRQPWVMFGEQLAHVPEMRWIRALDPDVRSPVRVNSLTTMMRACEEGLGLALLPCLIGHPPGLRRLDDKPVVQRELWLLSHRDAGSIARFRVVAAWLARLYVESQDMLCG